MNVSAYQAEWTLLNGNPPLNHATVNVPSLGPYLLGTPTGPTPSEQAWKDTINVNSGEVAVIRLRWTQQNGNPFSFDATAGPGYVWHCHILEHEDNEMMRPYKVVSSAQNLNIGVVAVVTGVAVVVVLAGLIVFKRVRNRSKRKM